jgi:hypothetical protein
MKRKERRLDRPYLLVLEIVFDFVDERLDGGLVVSDVKNDLDFHGDLTTILMSDLAMVFDLLPTTWWP